MFLEQIIYINHNAWIERDYALTAVCDEWGIKDISIFKTRVALKRLYFKEAHGKHPFRNQESRSYVKK